MKRQVTIPACAEHDGILSTKVVIDWVCPRCGGPRGEPHAAVSYDGSRRLAVDGWQNPCGHIDKYSDVLVEAYSIQETT